MPRIRPSVAWLILASFLLLLLASRMYLVQQQWQLDHDNAQKNAQNELDLLTTIIHTALS